MNETGQVAANGPSNATYVLTPAEAATEAADAARQAAKAAAEAADSSHNIAVELRRQAEQAEAQDRNKGDDGVEAKEGETDNGAVLIAQEAAYAAAAAREASEYLLTAVDASMAAAVELGDLDYEAAHEGEEAESTDEGAS